MRRMMTLLAAALLALTIAVPAGAKSENARTDHKVTICHFHGHEAESGHADFKIRGQGGRCARLGGEMITVSRNGARNGHGVG